MPRFRRAPQPPDAVDLDEALAAYEVTRTLAVEPLLTGLPEPSARRAAQLQAQAIAASEPDAPLPGDEAVPAGASRPAALPPEDEPADVRLHLGESLDLEVVDLDGTGYLFRGVVIGTDDTP